MKTICACLGALMAAICVHAQGPWLGGQQEYALGLKIQSANVMGLYVNRKTGTSIGEYVNKSSVDLRLGWMGWKVVNGAFGGKPCTILDTDALTTQVLKGTLLESRDTIKIARQTYVSPEGKILREVYSWQDGSGKWTADAIFGADSIELTTDGPKGAKTMTVFPAGGMDSFNAAFTPMIKNGEVELKEKTFSVLNPLTGGAQKVTARFCGHFDWTLGTAIVKKKGICIEYVWPDHTQKAYITDQGELVKIDLPAGRTLLFEVVK